MTTNGNSGLPHRENRRPPADAEDASLPELGPGGDAPFAVGKWSALGVALGLTVAAAAVAPFAQVKLGDSIALAMFLLGATALAVSITAVLLVTQANVARSGPMTLLAISYGFSSIAICLYTAFYPGLFEPARALCRVQPTASQWLWMTWQLGLLGGIIVYRFSRTSESQGTPLNVRPAVYIAVLLAITAVMLWAPLPQLAVPPKGEPTALFINVVGPIEIAFAGATVLVLYTLPGRSLLDCWLVSAATMIALDVVLAYLSRGRFTLGWYAARVLVLLATTTLLTVLLVQVAHLYRALSTTARKLRVTAATDELTGLPNRRRLEELLRKAIERAHRNRKTLSVAFIDIDHFKAYNDAYGHLSGDVCLRRVARVLSGSTTRATDLVGRFGGEEFLVVLEDADAEQAAKVSERIREALSGARLPHGGRGGVPYVTVTIGLATLRTGETLDDLISRADMAMYRAKRAGGNQVASAPPEQATGFPG